MRNKWTNIALVVLMTAATIVFFVFGIKVVQILLALAGWGAIIAKIKNDMKPEETN
jgi:hypothetical protein